MPTIAFFWEFVLCCFDSFDRLFTFKHICKPSFAAHSSYQFFFYLFFLHNKVSWKCRSVASLLLQRKRNVHIKNVQFITFCSALFFSCYSFESFASFLLADVSSEPLKRCRKTEASSEWTKKCRTSTINNHRLGIFKPCTNEKKSPIFVCDAFHCFVNSIRDSPKPCLLF